MKKVNGNKGTTTYRYADGSTAKLNGSHPDVVAGLAVHVSKGTKRTAAQLELLSANSGQAKSFMAIGPDGTIYNASNMTRFAAEHGLDANTIRTILNGRANRIAGWAILAEDGSLPEGVLGKGLSGHRDLMDERRRLHTYIKKYWERPDKAQRVSDRRIALADLYVEATRRNKESYQDSLLSA